MGRKIQKISSQRVKKARTRNSQRSYKKRVALQKVANEETARQRKLVQNSFNPVHKSRGKIGVILGIVVVLLLVLASLMFFSDQFVGEAITQKSITEIGAGSVGFFLTDGEQSLDVGDPQTLTLYMNLNNATSGNLLPGAEHANLVVFELSFDPELYDVAFGEGLGTYPDLFIIEETINVKSIYVVAYLTGEKPFFLNWTGEGSATLPVMDFVLTAKENIEVSPGMLMVESFDLYGVENPDDLSPEELTKEDVVVVDLSLGEAEFSVGSEVDVLCTEILVSAQSIGAAGSAESACAQRLTQYDASLDFGTFGFFASKSCAGVYRGVPLVYESTGLSYYDAEKPFYAYFQPYNYLGQGEIWWQASSWESLCPVYSKSQGWQEINWSGQSKNVPTSLIEAKNCIDAGMESFTLFDATCPVEEISSDIDGDGIENEDDTFPHDPAESVDTDGDGVGNNADTDDDGDGVSDVEEVAAGTDPLDDGDAPGDSSSLGDSCTNTADCGGEQDLLCFASTGTCLGNVGYGCTSDSDCGPKRFCDADGTCQGKEGYECGTTGLGCGTGYECEGSGASAVCIAVSGDNGGDVMKGNVFIDVDADGNEVTQLINDLDVELLVHLMNAHVDEDKGGNTQAPYAGFFFESADVWLCDNGKYSFVDSEVTSCEEGFSEEGNVFIDVDADGNEVTQLINDLDVELLVHLMNAHVDEDKGGNTQAPYAGFFFESADVWLCDNGEYSFVENEITQCGE